MNNPTIKALTNKKELTISSREIAELCNKRHDNVLRACRELKEKAISPQIEEIKNIDKLGRSYPEFLLNKRDSLVLVARLSPEFTAAVIDRWQELEKQATFKLPSNYLEALEQLTQEVKEKTALEQKLEEAKPKLTFANAVEGGNGSILIGELAKLLKQNGIDIGQNRLFDWLREHEYLHKNKNIPTQKAMELGLFNTDGETKLILTPKVTGKGQHYFINKFLSKELAI